VLAPVKVRIPDHLTENTPLVSGERDAIAPPLMEKSS